MTETFWQKWIKADAMERIEMIRTIPSFNRGGACRYMTATLFNSYLTDLYDEMKHE